MIKDIIAIENTSINSFNRELRKIVDEFQRDGYKVEVQYSTCEAKFDLINHSAVIIAKEKA